MFFMYFGGGQKTQLFSRLKNFLLSPQDKIDHFSGGGGRIYGFTVHTIQFGQKVSKNGLGQIFEKQKSTKSSKVRQETKNSVHKSWYTCLYDMYITSAEKF